LAIRKPIVRAHLPQVALGDWCQISGKNSTWLDAQVVGFDGEQVTLAPFAEIEGIYPGALVQNQSRKPEVKVSSAMLGGIYDALGRPLTAQSTAEGSDTRAMPLIAPPPAALDRRPIRELLPTGIRSIDTFCAMGLGQRLLLMAPAGAGKSTLLGMIARNAKADINVIALVGERGREVKDFVTEALGPEGLKRSVVIVTTSDESPLRRYLGALSAMSVAEYFRDQGKQVLLMLDSLTRMARALRDVSLAAGEIPIRQGYTPSVYSELPKLLERAGCAANGSITAIFSLLLNDDQEHDPLAEEVKSIVDGHMRLSNRVAEEGIRPALDILKSLSRLSLQLHAPARLAEIEALRGIIAKLKHNRDILLFGGKPDKELEAALQVEPKIKAFLSQSLASCSPAHKTWEEVSALLSLYRQALAH
jgi:flagellum-specific ATP synthase